MSKLVIQNEVCGVSVRDDRRRVFCDGRAVSVLSEIDCERTARAGWQMVGRTVCLAHARAAYSITNPGQPFSPRRGATIGTVLPVDQLAGLSVIGENASVTRQLANERVVQFVRDAVDTVHVLFETRTPTAIIRRFVILSPVAGTDHHSVSHVQLFPTDTDYESRKGGAIAPLQLTGERPAKARDWTPKPVSRWDEGAPTKLSLEPERIAHLIRRMPTQLTWLMQRLTADHGAEFAGPAFAAGYTLFLDVPPPAYQAPAITGSGNTSYTRADRQHFTLDPNDDGYAICDNCHDTFESDLNDDDWDDAEQVVAWCDSHSCN